MAPSTIALALTTALAGLASAYDNGSPARLPPMGWSSWIALGPGATPPIFDYCDEFSVKASVSANPPSIRAFQGLQADNTSPPLPWATHAPAVGDAASAAPAVPAAAVSAVNTRSLRRAPSSACPRAAGQHRRVRGSRLSCPRLDPHPPRRCECAPLPPVSPATLGACVRTRGSTAARHSSPSPLHLALAVLPRSAGPVPATRPASSRPRWASPTAP